MIADFTGTNMKRLLAIALLALLTGVGLFVAPVQGKDGISIDKGWEFRQVGTEEWHKAEVPGCVHTDLLANKMIEDPFYRDNEKGLQWIGKTDWEYRTSFNVDKATFGRHRIELVFEGLDTYAEVSLNGRPLLSSDNMFRVWVVNAKPFLKEGANELHIKFRSPINEILPLMAKLDYQIPAPNDQGELTSPYTRKAPYQYGWDWGPRFVTSGVWRPVRLRSWNDARIEDLNIVQNEVTSEAAKLTAEVEIDVATAGTYRVHAGEREGVSGSTLVDLEPGMNTVRIPLEIRNPRLWFPAGLGKQEMYEIEADLGGGETLLDTFKRRTGLRSLELRQKTDQWGKSFEFVVNGIPVFGKGGNWIPADSFPTRVTEAKYRHLLESFRDANMNMVRVWGGGIYEDDRFYELADELGLMVWQDFMFGVSMYPGDEAFLKNVRGEAVDNVKRLRNHPSIVIWVGNNESETAWQHWGWKEKLPDVLWENYKKIFLRLLPEVVEKYDPSRSYWSSSPSSDLEEDAESQKSGDLHYWAVWHASMPFSEYEKQFPRFMSEYGFQSFPDIDTVRKYTNEADRASIETPVMLAHQRHPRGNQLIREYMLREYVEPKDFESFLYVSQVLQAEGIKLGTEHLRRIRPRNMGALYWQLNDCWPVASWSSTDYFGHWKALQYYAKRFFTHYLVSPHIEESKVKFYIVSDDPAVANGTLKITAMDLSGNTLSDRRVNVQVDPLTSKAYAELEISELLAGGDQANAVIVAALAIGGETVSSNDLFLKPFKELKVSKPSIKVEVTSSERGFRILLSSDKVAKAVYLRADDGDGRFSDNFFNLLPGRPVEVEYYTARPKSVENFNKVFSARSLADAF
jgi:beta-mannosidase